MSIILLIYIMSIDIFCVVVCAAVDAEVNLAEVSLAIARSS